MSLFFRTKSQEPVAEHSKEHSLDAFGDSKNDGLFSATLQLSPVLAVPLSPVNFVNFK